MKRLSLFFLIILFLLSACQSEATMASDTENAQYVLNLIDKRIDEKMFAMSRWVSATVISSNGGSTVIHLPADPIGTNITVQNCGEVPVETGDQVYVLVINGSMTNAIVGYRKAITLDDIFVSYANGEDSYGFNASGYQYGTEDAPLKNLQYAMRRLPKNLNNRDITITVLDSPSGGGDSILFTDGFHSGYLTIQGLVDTYADINTLWMNNCSATISLKYLTPKNSGGLYLLRFQNCSNIIVNSCNLNTSETIGISAQYNTSIYISESDLSNQSSRAIDAIYNSKIISENNTGSTNGTVFFASYGSYVGILGTYPSGSTHSYADASSTVKP